MIRQPTKAAAELHPQDKLTVEEVAIAAGVSSRTVYRLVERGEIAPPERPVARWCGGDVIAYLERRKLRGPKHFAYADPSEAA